MSITTVTRSATIGHILLLTAALPREEKYTTHTVNMALGKRKRRTKPKPSPLSLSTPSATKPSAAKTSATLSGFATSLKQDPDKLSLLLDFPPEVRNIIYEMMCQDKKAVLSTSSNRQRLGSSSLMPHVNKQVRHEFGSVLLLVADITTIAKNFSFCHIGERAFFLPHLNLLTSCSHLPQPPLRS